MKPEKIISVMMPCRISVYEKEDGLTYIGLINTGEITSGLPQNTAKVMKDATDETFQLVKTIVE